MKPNQTNGFWRSAAQCLLGTIGVALLTLVCFLLDAPFRIVSPLYLIPVVAMSVFGGFVPSIFTSIIAALCLNYFFSPPIFSFWMNDPADIVAMLVFLGIATILARLITQRKRAEAGLAKALAETELKVQQRTAELAQANVELRAQIVERQRAEEALQKSQAELAHVTRVMTLGELMASIAHEVNQPLAAVVTNGQAGLRWLALETPRLDEVRAAVERIVRDGNRASQVIQRIRALAKRTPPEMVSLDINDVVREAIQLVQREVFRHGALLKTELTSALPAVLGDRVQLQQVVVNLVMNGVEAMATITDRPREIVIRSQPHDGGQVLVAVQDSGIGIDSENAERLFTAFFTTKSSGMGMGLSVSRSIIMAHGGKLWVSPNADHGAAFQFTVPSEGGRAP